MMQSSADLLCTKGTTHDHQPIIMICLNQECQTKRLCCLVCIDELHRKHQLVSLKKFQTIIKDSIYFNTQNPNKQSIQQLIREYQKSLHDKVNKLRVDCLKEIEEIDKKITEQFSLIYQTFQLENWSTIKKKYFDRNLTNDIVGQYLKKSKLMQNQLFVSGELVKSAIESTDGFLKKYFEEGVKSVKNSMNLINNNLEKIRLGSNSPTKLFLCRFNKMHKAAVLTYNEELNIVQRGQSELMGGGYPIALSEQPLTPSSNSISFRVDEQPGNCGIWMGVCILDVVKGYNFLNCYGLGKGTYAIDQFNSSSNTAYSWNHHDSNFNSKPIVGWNFALGQTVTISVNFISSTVTFSKGQSTYTQPIKLDTGDVYAFAGPTNIGDKISIVL